MLVLADRRPHRWNQTEVTNQNVGKCTTSPAGVAIKVCVPASGEVSQFLPVTVKRARGFVFPYNCLFTCKPPAGMMLLASEREWRSAMFRDMYVHISVGLLRRPLTRFAEGGHFNGNSTA